MYQAIFEETARCTSYQRIWDMMEDDGLGNPKDIATFSHSKDALRVVQCSVHAS
jgi:hypothetical protein